MAARNLGVTQPAVSQQLQELEALLRVRLIERVGIRMLPTPAGRAMIEPVRRAFAALDQVEPAIAPFRETGTGLVRVGTGATACIHFLPEPLARAQTSMPNLQLVVVTGNTSDIVSGVEEGTIDVGLVTADELRSNPSIHLEHAFDEELVAILPKRVEDQLPVLLQPRDLSPLPLILFDPAGRTRDVVNGWFRAGGVSPIPTMELGSIEAIKVLVGAGLGVSLIPDLATKSMPDTIVRRRLALPVRRCLSLILRTDKVLDSGLRALLSEIRASADSLRERRACSFVSA